MSDDLDLEDDDLTDDQRAYQTYANFGIFHDGEFTAFYEGLCRLLREGDEDALQFYGYIFQSGNPRPCGRTLMIEGLRSCKALAERLGVPWEGIDPDDEAAVTAGRRVLGRAF